MCECVCERARELGRENLFNGLNRRSLSKVKARIDREGGTATERNVNMSCKKKKVQ